MVPAGNGSGYLNEVSPLTVPSKSGDIASTDPSHGSIVSSYRFCRTDDIALLVDALNRCWAPHFPDEPPMTPAAFKRSIRDLQVWCSSCMVAFSGSDPIGVLIGAKRPSGTLVHKIAVHPDHRRQGHGRHLLASLGSKLAILGPPRMVAEVPETLAPACGLFSASGYVQEALLTDYVLPPDENDDSKVTRACRGERPARRAARFVIPVTVDDLAANGLLERLRLRLRRDKSIRSAGSARSRPSRQGRTTSQDSPSPPTSESRPIFFIPPDGGNRVAPLVRRRRRSPSDATALPTRATGTFRFPKVHPAEISKELLETLGFRPAGGHVLYAAKARSG